MPTFRLADDAQRPYHAREDERASGKGQQLGGIVEPSDHVWKQSHLAVGIWGIVRRESGRLIHITFKI